MKLPWNRTKQECDRSDVEDAKRRTQELEDRTENVGQVVRERDPWAGRVLDAIHHPRGEPHAHL